MGNLSYLVVPLLFIAGCGSNLPITVSENTANPPSAEENVVNGSFQTTEKNHIDFSNLKDKPMVLVFASDICSTCLSEAESFRDSLADPNVPPSQIHLVTLMVGIGQEDALLWKQGNQLSWTVGVDKNNALFKKYCGGALVPCTLVEMPGEGIVYKHVGESGRDTLEAITGPWEAN